MENQPTTAGQMLNTETEVITVYGKACKFCGALIEDGLLIEEKGCGCGRSLLKKICP